MAVQLLPWVPRVEVVVGTEGEGGKEGKGEAKGKGERMFVKLLGPERKELTDPECARWILSRCRNGTEVVGGVYLRMLKAGEETLECVDGKVEEAKEKEREEKQFMDDVKEEVDSGHRESLLSAIWGLIKERRKKSG